MYLFKAGDQNESMTGGWIEATQRFGVAAITDVALEAAAGTANQNYNRVAFRTANPIDLNDFKTIRATFAPITRNHTNVNVAVGVAATAFAQGQLPGDSSTVLSEPGKCMVGYTNTTSKQTESFTLEYDISAVNDSMYVVVYFGSVECGCMSVQLIP